MTAEHIGIQREIVEQVIEVQAPLAAEQQTIAELRQVLSPGDPMELPPPERPDERGLSVKVLKSLSRWQLQVECARHDEPSRSERQVHRSAVRALRQQLSINVDSALAFMNRGSKTRADSAEANDLTSMVKHKLGLEPWSSIFEGIRSTQAAMSVLEFVSNVSAFQRCHQEYHQRDHVIQNSSR